ncbi:MAG: amidohydrolase family protein, partial [Candidatus Methanomethylicia archaeon]
TLLVDMYFNPLMTAKAAAQTGLKAIISIGVFDFNDSAMRDEMIKSIEEYLFKVKIYEPKIIGSIGPHAPYTCSEELLLKCKDIAERENRLIHMHLAETLEEQVKFEEKYGKREVEFLDNLDFLSSNVIAAHCVWLNKNEIRILSEHNVKISHCPISNLKLAIGGVLPLSECLKNNVTISLGTDSAASNNSLNMFEVMKYCALIHKHHTLDPSIAPANLIFDFATINGAKATNYVNSLGKIVENAPADLVLLNANSPNIMPIHSEKSVYSNIVYSNISSSNIYQVIIDGEIVCLNGKLTKIDETRIYHDINKVIKDLFC